MKSLTRIVIGALFFDLNEKAKENAETQLAKVILHNRGDKTIVFFTEDVKFKSVQESLKSEEAMEFAYAQLIEQAYSDAAQKDNADKDIIIVDSYYNIDKVPVDMGLVDKQIILHFSETGAVNTESVVGVQATLESTPTNQEGIFLYNDLIGNKPDPTNLKQILKQFDIITSEFNELKYALYAYNALMEFAECHRGEGWAETFRVAYEGEPWYSSFIKTSEGAVTWREAVLSQYTEMRDGCCDVDVTVGGLRHQMGWYPDADLAEVNASNMSKFSYSDEELQATLDHYKALGLDVEVVTTGSDISGKTHSVRSKETKHIDGVDYRAGKQVKPPHYFKPLFDASAVRVPLKVPEYHGQSESVEAVAEEQQQDTPA